MKSVTNALAASALVLAITTGAGAGDAAGSYAAMKTLDGYWHGIVHTDFPQSGMDGVDLKVRIRVTSSGHAILQEIGAPAEGLGPDHMGDITVFHLIGDHLLADHYCDADNQPHMEAAPSSDAKTIVFDFISLTGSAKMGYIHDWTFKVISADEHNEDLTFVLPGDKVMHAHFDLRRIKP
jgi:hypothetical protein